MGDENSGFIPEHMKDKNPKQKYLNKSKQISMDAKKKKKSCKKK